MADHDPMPAVTPDRPCPACGKPDWCLLREDGKRGFCQRVPPQPGRGKPEKGSSGWLHIYEDDPLSPRDGKRRKGSHKTAANASPLQQPRAKRAPVGPNWWQEEVERFAARISTEQKVRLAASLGLPAGAVDAIPLVGWHSVHELRDVLSCPEVDAGGRVIGYVERYEKGFGRVLKRPGDEKGQYLEKITATGCDRGLTIPVGLGDRSGPGFCVEAFSDTAAMTAAGLWCVGRPFCDGGADLLVNLFRSFPADRPIVIVGEHDLKPDGKWPGKGGMERIAAHLTRELKRPILTALPPDDAKDVRAWLTHPDRWEQSWAERGAELSAKLMTVVVAATDHPAADPPMMARQQTAAEEKAEKKPSPLALLVKRACEQFDLFRNQFGEAFACRLRGPADGPKESKTSDVYACAVEEREFRDELYTIHDDYVDKVETPSTSTIRNAYSKLASVARKGERRDVFHRSGRHGDAVYVFRADLDHAPAELVRIDREGFRVIHGAHHSPVRFLLRPTAGILPPAEPGGGIGDLRPLLNLEDESQLPVIGAWLAAAVAGVPTPIMMLAGRMDSAKSTFSRMLMRLVDPNGGPMRKAMLLTKPKDDEDIMVAAKNNAIMCYDNLSGIDPELADTLCRVATGGYYMSRKKWTDGDQFLVDLQRSLILNGIDLPSLRSDFLSRVLTVNLRSITDEHRLTDEEVDAGFDAARPRVLAWVYDLVARGLDDRIDISGLRPGRMGWFSQFAARAIGVEAVNSVMTANVADNDEASLEGCTFLDEIQKVVDGGGGRWQGIMKDLLAKLNSERGARDKPEGWPADATRLSTHLTRHAPALERQERIKVDKGDGLRKTKGRLVVVTRLKSPSVTNLDDLTGPARPRHDVPSSSDNERPSVIDPASSVRSGLDKDLDI